MLRKFSIKWPSIYLFLVIILALSLLVLQCNPRLGPKRAQLVFEDIESDFKVSHSCALDQVQVAFGFAPWGSCS